MRNSHYYNILVNLLSLYWSVGGFPAVDIVPYPSETSTTIPNFFHGFHDDRGLIDPLENEGILLHHWELIEGDIMIPPGMHPREEAVAAAGTSDGRGANNSGSPDSGVPAQVRVAIPDLTWTDRIIPYVIDDGFNSTELSQIRLAIQELTESSGNCITFVPRDHQNSFVYITGKLDGCYSCVGRQGGNQTVSISSAHNCVTKGIIMHELMHVLGFLHEHTRRDRNTYIHINKENIIPGKLSDFSINKEADLQNISYDYYSIMHYKTNQFSIHTATLNTIDIRDPTINVQEVGQRRYLSEKDHTRIKKLYNCPLKNCSYPHTLNNGIIEVKNTNVGSSIRYSCTNQNHELIGAPERTCLLNGRWSGSTPICFDSTAAVLYCNFEEPGLCGWTQATTDEADWTRHNSQTPSENTGPIEDHTLQTPDGYYLYLEGSGLTPDFKARLISPEFPGMSKACLMFWYNMNGAGMGTLNVYLNFEDNNQYRIWTKSGNQGYGWKMALIPDLNSSLSFKVIFEAVRGNLDATDIAIDDVIIGECQNILSYKDAVIRELKEEYHNCDFDTEFCGWYQSSNATLSWYRQTGSTPSLFTGPSCDCNNCSICSNGSYVYIETSGSKIHGEHAQLISPPFKGRGYTCVEFEYHMFGRDIGNLSLYVIEENITSLIWSVSGDQRNTWFSKQLQLYSNDTFQIAFTATSGGSYRGDIAIDDVKLHSGRCLVLFQCDFDQQSLCEFNNDNTTDNFDWKFGGLLPILSMTGPRSDHTSGAGKFVYIDASAPRIPGDVAKLSTPPFMSTGHCLTYWYYMYERDVASLKTLIKYNNGTETLLEERHGNLGATWHKSKLSIPPQNNSIQVVFMAEVGQSYSSDIAIDDICITNYKC